MTRYNKGFTLVELSIVLVIIGLIVSSVLVGQDLIRGAEIRSTITQYENFNAAVGTFKGKYGGLPGDVQGNTDFSFVGDGNGDGVLKDASQARLDNSGEFAFFWNHLGASGAGLIPGTYDGVAPAADAPSAPEGKIGSRWGVFSSASDINYYILGVPTPGTAAEYDTEGFLLPLDAKNIDDKLDDGRPGRGVVQARGANANDGSQSPDNGAVTSCVSALKASGTGSGEWPAAASTYDTDGTTASCNLVFRMPF